MIFISFILDGICSNYFVPLFTLLTLIFIYNNDNKYLYTLIVGILYDVIYTDTLFLNTFVFFFLLFLIEKIFSYIRYNIVNVTLVSILIIVLYRIIIYVVLSTIGYVYFDLLTLLYSILISLFNVIFVIIFYLVRNLTNKRYML